MVWRGCNETKFGLRHAAPARGRVSEKEISENPKKRVVPARKLRHLARSVSMVAESKGSVEETVRMAPQSWKDWRKRRTYGGAKAARHKTTIFFQQARESRRFFVLKT